MEQVAKVSFKIPIEELTRSHSVNVVNTVDIIATIFLLILIIFLVLNRSMLKEFINKQTNSQSTNNEPPIQYTHPYVSP